MSRTFPKIYWQEESRVGGRGEKMKLGSKDEILSSKELFKKKISSDKG